MLEETDDTPLQNSKFGFLIYVVFLCLEGGVTL